VVNWNELPSVLIIFSESKLPSLKEVPTEAIWNVLSDIVSMTRPKSEMVSVVASQSNDMEALSPVPALTLNGVFGVETENTESAWAMPVNNNAANTDNASLSFMGIHP
jgi:hypothetical protein